MAVALILGGSRGPALAAPDEPMQVRLSFKRILPANGDSSPWSNAIVRTMVSEASRILRRRAGMSLRVVEILNIRDPEVPSSWSDVLSSDIDVLDEFAKQPTSGLAWRTGAVNVFLVSGLHDPSERRVGAICSFPGRDVIFIPNYDVTAERLAITLVHELGHYFKLFHTFEDENGSDDPEPCSPTSPICDRAGDLVCDTPPDPNDVDYLDTLYRAGCSLPDEHTYRVLRNNVMSYYRPIRPAEAILTAGQVERMRASAVESRSAVLAATPRPSIPEALSTARPDPRCVRQCSPSCTTACRSQSCRFIRSTCETTCSDTDEPECRAACTAEWRICLGGCERLFSLCREECLDSADFKTCTQPCREERAFCRTGGPCSADCAETCRRQCDQAPVPSK